MGPKKAAVEEEPPAETHEEDGGPQLPLSITASKPETLVFLLQTKEEEISIAAAKAVLKFVEDAWSEKKPEHTEEAAGKGKKGKGKDVQEEVVEDAGADRRLIHELGGIPVILQLILERSTQMRVLLLKTLIILCGDDGSRAAIVDGGIVEKSLSLLCAEEGSETPPVPELQVFACQLLALITVELTAQKHFFEQEGLKQITRFLQPDVEANADKLVSLTGVLNNCREHELMAPTLYNLNLFSLVISLLQYNDIDVQEHMICLLNAALARDEYVREARRCKAIEVVGKLLEPECTPKCRAGAADVVAKMAYSFESRQDVQNCGALRGLAKCIDAQDEAIVLPGLNAIRTCAVDMPIKFNLVVLGVVATFVKQLSSTSLEVAKAAALALAVTLIDAKTVTNALLAGALEPIVARLGEADSSVHIAFLEAVSEFAQFSEFRSEARGKLLPVLQTLLQQETEAEAAEDQQPNHELQGKVIQVLARIAYDSDERTTILNDIGVTKFVAILSRNDPHLCMASLQALNMFANEAKGREAIRVAGGIDEFIKYIRDGNLELQRAAVQAATTCAREAQSARELCDKGGLKVLLSVGKTHANHLGAVVSKCTTRVLNNYLPAKFWYTGELRPADKTSDGFFDQGLADKDYYSLEELKAAPVDAHRPQLLADTAEDLKLAKMIDELGPLIEPCADSQPKKAAVLGSFVSKALGGAVSEAEYLSFGYDYDVGRCKTKAKSNVIKIGELQKGICEHRAFLFKVLADRIGVDAAFIRSNFKRGAHAHHAWNMVSGEDGQPCVVDLMFEPGKLITEGTPEAARYRRLDEYAFSTLSATSNIT